MITKDVYEENNARYTEELKDIAEREKRLDNIIMLPENIWIKLAKNISMN